MAAGAGREILRGIADAAQGRSGAHRIDEITEGSVRAAGGVGAIPRRLAEKTAAAVSKKLG